MDGYGAQSAEFEPRAASVYGIYQQWGMLRYQEWESESVKLLAV